MQFVAAPVLAAGDATAQRAMSLSCTDINVCWPSSRIQRFVAIKRETEMDIDGDAIKNRK
jgi:hypothetical protein